MEWSCNLWSTGITWPGNSEGRKLKCFISLKARLFGTLRFWYKTHHSFLLSGYGWTLEYGYAGIWLSGIKFRQGLVRTYYPDGHNQPTREPRLNETIATTLATVPEISKLLRQNKPYNVRTSGGRETSMMWCLCLVLIMPKCHGSLLQSRKYKVMHSPSIPSTHHLCRCCWNLLAMNNTVDRFPADQRSRSDA